MVEISDIKASIQSKALIQDDFFKEAQFLKDSKGRLVSHVGGYTIVVPCIANGEKWAFRCWHLPVEDSKRRYSLISDAIRDAQLDFFCFFEYTEKGLLVNGESLPITKMKWVEGKNLNEYIYEHFKKRNKIRNLAQSFLKMVICLHEKKFAHGDLQCGNILVSESGQLYLVDYDSLYVPSMGNEFPDIIAGKQDYQHPARKENRFSSEKLDYFSELVIYTSLLGIAKKPDFAISYNVKESEGLLFSKSDFSSLESSKIYGELSALKNPEIDNCLAILKEYLSAKDINDLKPIESYLMSIKISAPDFVAAREKCTIKWISSGAAQVSIVGIGDVKPSDSILVDPSVTTDYTFVLTSEFGSTKEETIQIKVYNRGKINFFRSEREYTFRSVPINISWNCSDMVSVEIVGYGEQPEVGSLEVEIGADKVFVLRAKDYFEEFTQEFTVRALPFPSIKALCVPQLEAEYKSNLSIRPSCIDIKSLVSKVTIMPPQTTLSISTNPVVRRISVMPSKVEVSKGFMEFTDKTTAMIGNLLKITNQGMKKLINYITRK
jgi:serine/threonine protein kinase